MRKLTKKEQRDACGIIKNRTTFIGILVEYEKFEIYSMTRHNIKKENTLRVGIIEWQMLGVLLIFQLSSQKKNF